MISFVNTLNKLANQANSEAAKLHAKKDIVNANALFAKQGKFVTLIKELEELEKALASFKDPSDDSLNTVYAALLKEMEEKVKDLAKLEHNHKDLIAAINSPLTAKLTDEATHAVTLLKKNLEIRQKALKAQADAKDLSDEKRKEFLVEYKKRCQEDNANMLSALSKTTPFALGMSIEESNRRWYELLKRVFNIDPPAPTGKVVPKTNAFSDFFSKAIDAVSKFAKDMHGAKSKDEKEGVFMGFLGMIFPIVIGFISNLFKPFFGKTPEERETKAAEFTENVSHFLVDMTKDSIEEAKKKQAAKEEYIAKWKEAKAKKDAKDAKPEGAPILPMMDHKRATAKSVTTPSLPVTSEMDPEAIASILSM